MSIKILVLLVTLAAGASAPAASIAVRQTTLDRPWVWQNGDRDPVTGEAVDTWGYRSYDIDQDGVFDIGFTGGGTTELAVSLNKGVEVLVHNTQINTRSNVGVLAHSVAGAILGADSDRGLFGWYRGGA